MLNSKTALLEKSIYSSESEKENEGGWIQPSIIQQNIEIRSKGLIDGIYVQLSPASYEEIIDKQLVQELAAWDAASRHDYWDFEDSLKK